MKRLLFVTGQPGVGKTSVLLRVVDALKAMKDADVIVVDEIGPMELFSQAFKDAIVQAVDSNKPILGTIHFRAQNPLINAIKARNDVEIFEVTNENRESIHNLITTKILRILQK